VSPVRSLRGQRGLRVLILAWATVVAIALPVAGYMLASAPGEIQRERAEAIRVNCQEQNVRHDLTIRKLDELIDRLPPGRRKRRAVSNRDGTVALIEALAPKRDCERLVRESVQTAR
jgi:hypothetical protein